MDSNVVEQYKTVVWWTMDATGVSRSLWWKVLTAVGIQFLVSVALTVVPLVFSGWLRVWATVALFGLAIVAFVNTVLVVRDDVVEPMLDLQRASRRIEQGDLDVAVPATDQDDEIGHLCRSFADMHAHINVVADQAEALADQRFDDPVLDRDLPGRFGHLLGRMTDELKEHVTRIEADRDRFKLLNHLVGHDVPNLVNVVYARLDLLREKCDDPDVVADLDVIEDQTEEIEYISNTVAELTSEETVRRVDVKHLLAREAERIRDSFPDATVTLDLPDGPVYVRGNDLLARAFENLITNGIEHNDSAEPRVDVSLTDTDDAIELTVTDDGPGFDADDPERVFETASEGTGLNIVDTIVTAFDGEIRLADTDENGTKFVVRLPRTEQVRDDETDGETADWLDETQATGT